MSLDDIRQRLRETAPTIATAVFDTIAPQLIGPQDGKKYQPKDINDPVWKIVSLSNKEVALLDQPLMQRLRYVRQLGLAHLVYPGAHHSRLEHSIGAMHAAEQMFDSLVSATKLSDQEKADLKQVVRLAALLHDCGHTAFSHVGERVLARAFRDEFEGLKTALEECFPDELLENLTEHSEGTANKSKPPPAAEILSTLFVLSEEMGALLAGFGFGTYSATTVQEMLAGLILGRPKNLRFGATYYHFIKNIVSGDLDADKIDYVARDAYYAGLPVSADVTRLLSQLVPVALSEETDFSDGRVRFGGNDPDEYQLLGIRPSGAAALEMFVMTRSYLFDRIYAHAKTRSAERYLERILLHHLAYREANNWSPTEVLDFYLSPTGDDGTLDRLMRERLDDGDGFVRERTKKIVAREIPYRAICISPRFAAEYSRETPRSNSAAVIPWDRVNKALSSNPDPLEDEICKLTGLQQRADVFVDWHTPNPVKENPDIWVSDPTNRKTIRRVNEYFDVEQLSNAYRDVKQVAWVFSPRTQQAKVAAAAAVVLLRDFDFLVGLESVRRAKLHRDDFVTALGNMSDTDPAIIAAIRDDDATQKTIRSLPQQFGDALGGFNLQDRDEVSARLHREFAAVRLPRDYYDDFVAALAVFNILSVHCKTFSRHEAFRYEEPRRNEKRFQVHLKGFLQANSEFSRQFEVTEGEHAAGGIADLIIRSRKPSYRPTVVELKSAPIDYAAAYENHLSQPSRYAASGGHSRISFLYCQHKSDTPVRPIDTFCIKKHQTREVVFCMGQEAFWSTPSS